MIKSRLWYKLWREMTCNKYWQMVILTDQSYFPLLLYSVYSNTLGTPCTVYKYGIGESKKSLAVLNYCIFCPDERTGFSTIPAITQTIKHCLFYLGKKKIGQKSQDTVTLMCRKPVRPAWSTAWSMSGCTRPQMALSPTTRASIQSRYSPLGRKTKREDKSSRIWYSSGEGK